MLGAPTLDTKARCTVTRNTHLLAYCVLAYFCAEAPRVNRLVFIGKHLNREELTASFESCMLTPP